MNLTKYHRPGSAASKSVPVQPAVFIVDSDPWTRDSLELLVRRAGWQPRTSASAEEFLARPRTLAPSCLILELRLPGMSGLELQALVRHRPELSIIFVSNHIDVVAIVQAMKAGALEFLRKPLADDSLLNVIRDAIECSEAALRHHLEMNALRERYESLSRREREVMGLVVTGRLNKQVGGDLGISEYTVKAHRRKVMRKMRAATYGDLFNMVARLQRTQLDQSTATIVQSHSSRSFDVIDTEVPTAATY